jgi:hypothetical protein
MVRAFLRIKVFTLEILRGKGFTKCRIPHGKVFLAWNFSGGISVRNMYPRKVVCGY